VISRLERGAIKCAQRRPRQRPPSHGACGSDDCLSPLSAAAADHGAHGLVGPEILGTVDIEQRRELGARPVDAALDGADGAAADRGRILVGEAGGADQDERFALVLRKLLERDAKLLELEEFRVALDKLPQDQREALILVGASGFSYEDAAAICGCAVGTIKSRVNRARSKLAALLYVEGAEDFGPDETVRAVIGGNG